MKLEHLIDCHIDLKPIVSVGLGPYGTRMIADVVGGKAEGARLRGSYLASGADWLLVDEAGIGHLDVRCTLETHDGALIYIQYYGVLELNDKVAAVMASGTGVVDYGETHFVTQPRFETGDDRYRWINSVVAVAEGRLLANAVEYRIYQASSA